MMNTGYAKNGQLVYGIKAIDKRGQLLHVNGYEYTSEEKQRLTKIENKPDLIDSLQVLYNPSKHSRAYQGAKKHLGVSNKQINNARKALNREAD